MKLPRIPHAWLLFIPPAMFALGFALNAIVMGANGAQMPVMVPGGDCSLIPSEDVLHSCATVHTQLKFLSDWIVVPHMGVASLGDFFEWAFDQTMIPAFTAWMALVIKEHHDRTAK